MTIPPNPHPEQVEAATEAAFREIYGDTDPHHAPESWDFAERVAGAVLASLANRPADAGGWIIGNGDGTQWRTWSAFGSEWTNERTKATRYHRREDAEAVHQGDEDAWRVLPFANVDADEFATVEPWEHDDQRELSLLYNHHAHDYPQFNRGQMRCAIRHGKSLANRPADDGGQSKRRAALVERIGIVADLTCDCPLQGALGDVAYELLRQAAAQIASDGQRLAPPQPEGAKRP